MRAVSRKARNADAGEVAAFAIGAGLPEFPELSARTVHARRGDGLHWPGTGDDGVRVLAEYLARWRQVGRRRRIDGQQGQRH
ncbi:MAG TPA: hypothetical protein PLB97_05495 [Accumulibacter sp.]|jgi:hypothetical protein|nr:hypothetical protein [Accumulibacter sp.]